MIVKEYRSALKQTAVASAFPYGYTLTIWTSGAVLSHARGLPTTGDAFLFMAGALAGFALVALVAFGGLRSETVPDRGALSVWEAFHLLSIGAAIGVAALVAHLLHSFAAWPLVGFLATVIYLATVALQISLLAAAGESRETEPD
jgi:hypothetical protein